MVCKSSIILKTKIYNWLVLKIEKKANCKPAESKEHYTVSLISFLI